MKTALLLASWSCRDQTPLVMRYRSVAGRARWFAVLRGVVARHPGKRLHVAVREPYQDDFLCLTLRADSRGRVRETRGWRVKRTVSLIATGQAFGRRAVAS